MGLKFPTGIVDPSTRITTYCADVFERLEAVGYGEFKTANSKHTIRILLKIVRPVALKTSMEQRLQDETGLDKDVRLFIKRLRADAQACQEFGTQVGNDSPQPEHKPDHGGKRTGDK